MDKYKFGEFIYNQRKLIGLTQDELGRKLNVTNKAVSKWETGETLPDIQLLEKLASTLNVTIDELLTQKKEDKKIDPQVVKPKIYLHIVQGVINVILLMVIIFMIFKPNVNSQNNKIITKDNIYDYLSINECEQSYVEGEKLTIQGSIKQHENAKISNIQLILSFSIQYYYYNDSDELSEILYVKREITYNGEHEMFTICVEPKDSLKNFKSFYGFNIVYDVVKVEGQVEALL